MKRFQLKKEFFGGILYDNKSKKNIFIHKDLCDLIDGVLCENNNEIPLEKQDIIELIKEMFDLEFFTSNIEFESNGNNYDDHLSAPFRIFYDITYECNLRCKHCFTNSGCKKENELSLDEKINLISQIKKLGTNRISIAGGEPFVCKDIIGVLECCMNNDIDVSITTNGTCFSKELIEKINEYNLKNLTVSFDGGQEETMDLIRGKGTYEQVINGLSLLKKYYKHEYSIKTTLMKSNMEDIDEIINTAIKYGCKTVKFNCVREDGRAVNNRDLVILSNKEYINIVKYIESIKNKYQHLISIKAPLNIFCDDEYDYIENLGFGCFAGKESMCIDPMGNIKPCSHFPKEYICGNIKNDSLINLWHESSIFMQFRHLKGNEKCNKCEHYNMCRAGCRFRAFKAGDINGVDPYCYLEK